VRERRQVSVYSWSLDRQQFNIILILTHGSHPILLYKHSAEADLQCQV